jgi:penicillin amidase
MSSPVRRRFRLLASILSVLGLLLALAAGWFYFQLRASRPQLDGAAALAGLSAPVTVTRDALGVPTIRAANRVDVAHALGYLHAQDRFFQMDLLRRRGAGELAELIGPAGLGLDRSTRRHGFRALPPTVAPCSPATPPASMRASPRCARNPLSTWRCAPTPRPGAQRTASSSSTR